MKTNKEKGERRVKWFGLELFWTRIVFVSKIVREKKRERRERVGR